MNPRRRRHNKRARVLRAAILEYRRWIAKREAVRSEVMREACDRAMREMKKLLEVRVLPPGVTVDFERGTVSAIFETAWWKDPR